MRAATSTIRSKVYTAKLYEYETLRLKTYLDIVNTGDYNKLIIRGYATIEQCYDQWEKIVEQHTEANGNNGYEIYREQSRKYAMMVSRYLTEKSLLTSLLMKVDMDKVEQLRQRGYRIKGKTIELYLTTISRAIKQCNNIMVKATVIRNDMIKNATKQDRRESFHEVLATLNFMLGFTVPETVTLAEFNEYRKLIQKKIDVQKTAKNG